MVTKGEVCFVLLINHPKLPDDKYFIEKEDGTSEWLLLCYCYYNSSVAIYGIDTINSYRLALLPLIAVS